jgi:hypothetical protein
VIEAAAGQEALGWKVNGAGGDGGTVTVLSATQAAKTGLDGAIGDLDPRYRVLTTRLSRSGLSVRGRLQDVPGWPRRSRRR